MKMLNLFIDARELPKLSLDMFADCVCSSELSWNCTHIFSDEQASILNVDSHHP